MFQNYLVTALRNLVRHKLSSFINIGGLAVGLACAIFILLFLRDELSYDKWIPGSENLYRVEVTIDRTGRTPIICSCAPMPVPIAMHDQIPGVTAATRVIQEDDTVTTGDRQFYESIDFVDPNFLEVIRLPLVEGNPASALVQPESIIISQSTARKYFGDIDPLGKPLTIGTAPWGACEPGSAACKILSYSAIVSGVLRDLPHNTHLVADLIMPNTSKADTMPQLIRYGWGRVDAWGYVALAPGTNPDAVLAKLKPIIDQNVSIIDPASGKRRAHASDFHHYHLTRFQDAHLTPVGLYNMKPPGNWDTVYGFAVTLFLIILVACFNFTNLMTAQASLRAREISLRKCMGATRAQLITQFLGESVLMALISLVIALTLVEMLLPLYDRFLDRPITFDYASDWRMLLSVIAGAAAVGILGGIYPALVLSKYRPATILRTNASGSGGAALLRTFLVIAQFAVSIGLGIVAATVLSQVHFERTMDFGFNRDNILYLWADSSMTVNAREALARTLRTSPGISGVTLSQENAVPFGTGLASAAVRMPGDPQTSLIDVTYIDPEFPAVYGIKLLSGRLLSEDRGEDRFMPDGKGNNDGRNLLINAAAARGLGLTPAQAVGKSIIFGSQLPPNTRATIAGVLDDAKDHGARETTTPLAYIYRPENNNTLSVRLRGNDISGTLSFIDSTWRSFEPSSHIQRFFLTDDFNRLFESDELLGAILGMFVFIAVFIACLGLFGLSAFAAGRRTKEIGVRKVFGAGTTDIVRLFLWQFSIPVLLANVIAWPIAYYFLHRWLEGYAYRISLNLPYFVTAALISLLIAWVTVFAHTLRAARANPIHALRYE